MLALGTSLPISIPLATVLKAVLLEQFEAFTVQLRHYVAHGLGLVGILQSQIRDHLLLRVNFVIQVLYHHLVLLHHHAQSCFKEMLLHSEEVDKVRRSTIIGLQVFKLLINDVASRLFLLSKCCVESFVDPTAFVFTECQSRYSVNPQGWLLFESRLILCHLDKLLVQGPLPSDFDLFLPCHKVRFS